MSKSILHPNIVNLDFETRSACDLIKEGGYRYYTDNTTEVICAAYSINDEPIKLWVPGMDYPFPDDITIQAWNANFERGIWQYVCTNEYGWPKKRVEDFICTAALSRTNGLPGKLADAGMALHVDIQKSRRGEQLIKLLSIPIDYDEHDWPIYNEDPDLYQEMYDYCIQDVATEQTIARCLRDWRKHELYEYWANEHVNDNGLHVDVSFAEKAVSFSEMEMGVLQDRLFDATEGDVEKPTQHMRVKNWLLFGRSTVNRPDIRSAAEKWPSIPGYTPRISDDALTYLRKWDKGERKLSLDKATRYNLLAEDDANPGFISAGVREVVELVDLAGRSSTAKYRRMLEREIDGKVHGAYLFAGAASTGRFSSVGVQTHNLVRDCVEDFDEALAGLENMADTEVIHTLAKMMRPTICAEPGKTLFWSDWSNVEGRGLPWLADSRASAEKLALFKAVDNDDTPGRKDVYEIMADRMGLQDRQTGKVAELSLGFGGSIGALLAMARGYNVRIEKPQKVVEAWREANPWARPFWYSVKDAAWDACATPGKKYHVGRLKYFYTPDTHNGLGTLWCELPSKRLLAYPDPRFEMVKKPWAEDDDDTMLELTALKANWKPKAGDPEWPRHKLWYGVLVENATQAICADLLRHVLVQLRKENITVIGHTHDEVIATADGDIGNKLKAIMQDAPPWAVGLPLVADINSGQRYSK